MKEFVEILAEANKHQNLLSRRMSIDDIRWHIDDCLMVLEWVNLAGQKVVDMGSGQGLPGIVLAAAEPSAFLVLVEADGRKCLFLREAAARLGLKNVEVRRERVESLGHQPEHRGKYDVVTARGVGSLPVVLEWGLPLLKRDGLLVSWKGPDLGEELVQGEKAAAVLGGVLEEVFDYQVGGKRKALVIYKKVADSPEKYPRSGGMAKKRPLGG